MSSDQIDLLDHGYLKLIESWGSDERIIEAARMSTQKGFLGWGPKCRSCGLVFTPDAGPCPSPSTGEPLVDCGVGGHYFDAPGDEKLLRYLWENKHATPFEFAGLVIEVQAPIFVFREWHRHRTQSYNEMSARYTPLPDLNYIPTMDRLMLNAAGTNKQAGSAAGAEALTLEAAEEERRDLAEEYAFAEDRYQRALKRGVPKELARIRLPVGRYSRMRASTSLRNWLGFLTLRMAPQAQWEIRQYADAVGELIAERFPRTWQLFSEGSRP